MAILRRSLGILFLLTLIVAGSWLSTRLWGGKSEEAGASAFMILPGETVGGIGERLNIQEKALTQFLSVRLPEQAEMPLTQLGLDTQSLHIAVEQAMVLSSDASSKNWFKIPLKFALWMVAILLGTIWMRKGTFTGTRRLALYAAGAFFFGVVLGSDPSPMGPVKDSLTLYGIHGIIFRPRVVAFFVFSAMVLLVNKSICSWGCQLGTLQGLLFRLWRGTDATRMPQIRMPFWLSNSIRILVFLAFCFAAFVLSFDLIGAVDPFKLYHPTALTIGGILLLVLLLGASLIVYRPWCQLACPFGLVGWVIEQFSFLRIRIDENKCTSCGACTKACPTEAMKGILAKKIVRADCFSCGTCQSACPEGAIHFGVAKHLGKRHGEVRAKP